MSWNNVPLSELLTVQNGYAFDSKKFSAEGDIGLIRIRDIKEGRVTDTRYTGEYEDKYIVRSGDYLIGMDGEFGCYEWKGENALLNQRVCRLEKFSSSIEPKFLLYGINKYLKDIEAVTGFTTVKHLSSKQIAQIKFPVPQVSEQKRIVEILDEAFEGIDAAIANTEKNLAYTRELFENYIRSVFTKSSIDWKEYRLGEVCDFLNGFAFKSTEVVENSNVQLIRMGNLYQNVLNLERSPVFYPENFKDEYSRYILKEGDLIMSLTGTVDKEDYGFTIEVPVTSKVLLLNQRIAKFINIRSNLVEKRFFFYILKSSSFLEKLYKSARGTRQANLSSVEMKNINFHLPSLKEQINLIEKFDLLSTEKDNLIETYEKKLILLNELKQSLLQKAFRGELTSGTDTLAEAAA